MDTHSLPLVPFGKYKGQPITNLLNDTKYLEWCKQQEWLQKFPIVYNICINQTIATTNQNSKTPEHNKLQNMFLNEQNQIKLLNILLGSNIGVKFKTNFELLISDEEFINCFGKINMPKINCSLKDSKIVFEDKYNWDFILYYSDYQTITFEPKCNVENLTEKYLYGILRKYNFEYNPRETTRVLDTYIEKVKEKNNYEVNVEAVVINSRVCCELKPILSDDYPCVLRKLKTQIELTESDKIFKDLPKYYIIVIGNFTSKYTSKEQLITIFKQSKIQIIFANEIFESSNTLSIKSINENTEETLYKNKLIEENKILTNNLLQTQEKLLRAEEKIKDLEELILSLKNQEQIKSIKAYFGEK
jgi:hypothetical protein